MTAATTSATAEKSENAALSREIEGLRKDLSALTERFSNIGDVGVRTASGYTRQKSAEAREKGEAASAELSTRASELESQAAESIRNHPLQALGLAAGIGFLAALLTRR